MRIGIAIGSAQVGGAEKQSFRTACELQQLGHEVEVLLLTDRGPLLEILDQHNVPWSCFDLKLKGNPFRLLRNLMRLSKHLKVSNFDVLHAYLAESIILTFPLIQLHHLRTKRVAGVRGSIFRRSKIARRLYGTQLRRANSVICNSTHLVDELVSQYGVPKEIIHVVSNGLDMPSTRADVTIQPPTIALVSNLHAYKGIDFFLRSFAIVDGEAKVLIMGEGPERTSLELLTAELGLSSKVKFLGHVNVPEILAQCQFAVHPSFSEGLSNAILEEISFGLPVIACDIGGNRNLIVDGTTGFIVQVKDIETLGIKIGSLISDLTLRERMSALSEAKAFEFNWTFTTNRLVRLYQSLLH